MKDKLRLWIYGGVTAAVFILAAVIPLTVSGGRAAQENSLSLGERAAIFAQYWNSDSGEARAEKIETPDAKDERYCRERMKKLLELCSVDKREQSVEYSGSEYLSISSADGEMRICRMWVQRQGDWRSWVDVCFDMDTGDVYYLYTSSECVTNSAEYIDAVPAELDAKYVADYISENTGYSILRFDWSGGMGDTADVILIQKGNAAALKINCTYYTASLLDIKIVCA